MIRPLLLLALAPLLGGCVVATVAGVAVGAAKTTARAAGTVVETAVDATTTTQQEADEDRGRAIRLEIDGGVKADNIGAIARAGADTFVAGSAIFNATDYAGTIAAMRTAIG
jgi:pentose-5-phosphate-3-epimerase